ncbi:hypothetical protein BV20DRAFT_963124 [Pilatotrama ljubarskyi]|nr:hypothetical protein BV20DRAFT_963124 [Pilatotrama ljubarskyi]
MQPWPKHSSIPHNIYYDRNNGAEEEPRGFMDPEYKVSRRHLDRCIYGRKETVSRDSTWVKAKLEDREYNDAELSYVRRPLDIKDTARTANTLNPSAKSQVSFQCYGALRQTLPSTPVLRSSAAPWAPIRHPRAFTGHCAAVPRGAPPPSSPISLSASSASSISVAFQASVVRIRPPFGCGQDWQVNLSTDPLSRWAGR